MQRYIIFSFLISVILLFFPEPPANDRMQVRCLNKVDTLSQKINEWRSVLLVESLGDTLSGFDIRSSCGCEYPVWKKGMVVYPGHPDTIFIVSSLKGHKGHWLKQTIISTASCSVLITTGPWVITE